MKLTKGPLRDSGGMTLIEVLVSLLIFSFGLLGFVGLQARAIQYSVGAENSNRAALLANEMATTIQLAGLLPFASTTDVITPWQNRVKNAAGAGLPNATGTVTPVGTNGALITITWQPTGTSAASTATNKYVTLVTVP